MNILQAVRAVKQVAARKIEVDVPRGMTFFSGTDIWLYDIREDDVTCEICRNIADQASLMGGFNGNSLRALFPHYIISGLNVIEARAHMPRDDNCRCRLTRYVGDPVDRVPAQKHLVPEKMEPEKKVGQLPTGTRKKQEKVT